MSISLSWHHSEHSEQRKESGKRHWDVRLGVLADKYSHTETVAGCPMGEEEKDIGIPEHAGISTGAQLTWYIAILFYLAFLSTPNKRKKNITLISNQQTSKEFRIPSTYSHKCAHATTSPRRNISCRNCRQQWNGYEDGYCLSKQKMHPDWKKKQLVYLFDMHPQYLTPSYNSFKKRQKQCQIGHVSQKIIKRFWISNKFWATKWEHCRRGATLKHPSLKNKSREKHYRKREKHLQSPD